MSHCGIFVQRILLEDGTVGLIEIGLLLIIVYIVWKS